jgi:hypothetical protein
MNGCAQTTRRQAEQTASRADVQKTAAAEILYLEHALQRSLSARDAFVVQCGKKPAPVLPELEPLPLRDFDCMRCHRVHSTMQDYFSRRKHDRQLVSR